MRFCVPGSGTLRFYFFQGVQSVKIYGCLFCEVLHGLGLIRFVVVSGLGSRSWFRVEISVCFRGLGCFGFGVVLALGLLRVLDVGVV